MLLESMSFWRHPVLGTEGEDLGIKIRLSMSAIQNCSRSQMPPALQASVWEYGGICQSLYIGSDHTVTGRRGLSPCTRTRETVQDGSQNDLRQREIIRWLWVITGKIHSKVFLKKLRWLKRQGQGERQICQNVTIDTNNLEGERKAAFRL